MNLLIVFLNSFQWLCLINCAVLYNLIFVIGRSVFWELQNVFPVAWYFIDYSCDLLYVIDTFIRMHEGKKFKRGPILLT